MNQKWILKAVIERVLLFFRFHIQANILHLHYTYKYFMFGFLKFQSIAKKPVTERTLQFYVYHEPCLKKKPVAVEFNVGGEDGMGKKLMP